MVRVPPGRFVDGEGATRRELLVSRPFELGVAPVTQALWQAVMGSNLSHFIGEDLPMEEVSWNDAQRLMAGLAKCGLPGFRLPTGAEWAWAARCGVPTRWAGADRVKVVAVTDRLSGVLVQTAAVGGLSSSVAGAFDLSGNVWEWVGDWAGSVPSTGVDAQGPALGSRRIDRGGSWLSEPKDARVAVRDDSRPDYRDYNFGFRISRTAS
jgi:formylglycine-generating enzyme required for sulfatase activity